MKMGIPVLTFVTIRQVTARYHPLALRYFLMSAHYRSPLSYTRLQLERSSDALYYVYQTLQDLVEALAPYQEALKDDNGKSEQTSEAKHVIKNVKSKFEANMSDDLNSSPILTGALQTAMKFINVSITKLKKMHKQQQMSLAVSLVEVEKAARGILDVLGLLTPLSYTEFLKEMKQKALARAGLGEEDVFQKIDQERKMKRKMKEFERSDEIRYSLAVKGISLMDIPGKYTLWRPSLPCSWQLKPGCAGLMCMSPS